MLSRHWRSGHARHAAASAIELDRAIRFGFQMKIDSSTALAETARSSAAIRPASGPPIERASQPVTATAATPPSGDQRRHGDRDRRATASAAGARSR